MVRQAGDKPDHVRLTAVDAVLNHSHQSWWSFDGSGSLGVLVRLDPGQVTSIRQDVLDPAGGPPLDPPRRVGARSRKRCQRARPKVRGRPDRCPGPDMGFQFVGHDPLGVLPAADHRVQYRVRRALRHRDHPGLRIAHRTALRAGLAERFPVAGRVGTAAAIASRARTRSPWKSPSCGPTVGQQAKRSRMTGQPSLCLARVRDDLFTPAQGRSVQARRPSPAAGPPGSRPAETGTVRARSTP